MLTLCIAAAVLAACTALRWFLNRPERKDEAFWNGRIRLTALWNEGAGARNGGRPLVPVPRRPPNLRLRQRARLLQWGNC